MASRYVTAFNLIITISGECFCDVKIKNSSLLSLAKQDFIGLSCAGSTLFAVRVNKYENLSRDARYNHL